MRRVRGAAHGHPAGLALDEPDDHACDAQRRVNHTDDADGDPVTDAEDLPSARAEEEDAQPSTQRITGCSPTPRTQSSP